MKYDVLTIGITNCDLIFANLEKLPVLGQEEYTKDFYIKAGGAANTPMALAKLGLKSAYYTKLGTDVFGQQAYNFMKRTGMDMSAVMQSDTMNTSVTAVLSIGRERGFATFMDDTASSFDIGKLEPHIRGARHVHTGIAVKHVKSIVETAKKYKKSVSLDAMWDESLKLDNVKDVLSQVDIFIPNEAEALYIAGTDNLEEALERISRYPEITVIKMGSKGSMAKQGDKIIKTPAVDIFKPVDTTGAGDLFNAGFIYGYLKGWEVEKATRFANITGGLAVTFYGGMDEAFSLKRILEYFK